MHGRMNRLTGAKVDGGGEGVDGQTNGWIKELIHGLMSG